jgi:hypothetical protein
MKNRPVKACVKVGGMHFFARTLDKIRLNARGELHEDHVESLGKGFDGRLCRCCYEVDEGRAP